MFTVEERCMKIYVSAILFVAQQSLQSNQEATELLENVRKSKGELQTQLEKLQV